MPEGLVRVIILAAIGFFVGAAIVGYYFGMAE